MLGIHINKENFKNFSDAFAYNTEQVGKIECCQIFTHVSQTGRLMNWKENPHIPTFIHAPYVWVNMWNAIDRKNETLDKVVSQMKTGSDVGAIGVVFHIKNITAIRIGEVLSLIHKEFPNDCYFLIENHAYKSSDDCSYETPAKLNNLTDTLDAYGITNYGLCIDTAHLWASMDKMTHTIYSPRFGNTFRQWLYDLSPLTISKIKLIHLNGSLSEPGSGKDKHAIPAFDPNDQIWGAECKNLYASDSGLVSLLAFCDIHKIPLVIENNSGSNEHLKDALKHLGEIYHNFDETSTVKRNLRDRFKKPSGIVIRKKM